MLDKDFNWCYNHENLFREWLRCIYNLHKSHPDERLESNTIFLLWQEAKECALEIANSEEPGLLYRIRMNDVITKRPNHWKGLMYFLNTMLTTSKNKNLEIFANIINKTVRDYLNKKKIDENSIDEFAKDTVVQTLYLASGQVKSDYDYSLPDGGIKDETETDETITITKTDETKTITKTKTKTETITKTKTKTETITKAKTETDGSVTLPDVLDTNEFKKYLSLAKEKGLIKDVNGKLEWIQIGNRGGDSQLAYFLGRAFGYIHSENGNNGNEFPSDELDELFGVTRIYRLLVQVHSASKPQKWRRKIDELFE